MPEHQNLQQQTYFHLDQVKKPTGSEVKWSECSPNIGKGYKGCRVYVFAWSWISQSVCEWTFVLLANWCIRLPSLESCIQQRKTTNCILSIRESLACVRSSKLQQTYISPDPGAKAKQQWSQVDRMLAHHRDGLSSSSFCLIVDNAVGLWVGIQSAGDLVSQTSQFRILHSPEAHNLSNFDSKIACRCQSIKINDNRHTGQKAYSVVCDTRTKLWKRFLIYHDSGII